MKNIEKSLTERLIAIPESRQLDVLANLLEQRGARVLRCPLVTILDTPDQAAVVSWLERFIGTPSDEFIILTGEGLRRLYAAAQRIDRLKEFTTALATATKITRGPKPGQALKEAGLKPEITADKPTTPGVIETLERLDIDGHRIAVQLYGEDPNRQLIDYLQGRNVIVDTVAPYIYASDSDDQKVADLIKRLAEGTVDAITFTSQPQVKRLFDVAEKFDLQDALNKGLNRTLVAAVGPVVAAVLSDKGIKTDLVPETSYFMKPMVTLMVKTFAESD